MTATDANDTNAKALQRDLASLGLLAYVEDLDNNGFTVIPPSIANPDGLADRMLSICLDIAEARMGSRPDLARGETGRDSPVGDTLKALLLEDPVFEEALMNPALLAVSTHLCGYDVVLSSLTAFLKGASDVPFSLHTDTRLPSPLPDPPLLCKCIYALTDFNRENGSTAFVPGSHKWTRNPEPHERRIEGNPDAIAVDAPAGSLIIFQGNTWHGAYNRQVAGIRASVHLLMVRSLLRVTEDFMNRIPQEALTRNSARFAILTQQGVVPGYVDKQDEIQKVMRAMSYVDAFEDESGISLPVKR
ncbi:MAG: hypothetical protein CMP98_03060 [Gammaproteobacteria bacterium]|nr:hypothetical protein [Gammaproteobacteria bacterium]OUU11184.1 MAG: hypothetical protein CBB94_03175 [Gammaproteobacteria bacterium TMED34]|tara:strand:+ start:225 stop:1133 length:909 start_codon:yes stop_codon:yes gene_type:complete